MSNQFGLALSIAKVWDIEPGRSNNMARSAAKGTDALSLIVMGLMSRPHAPRDLSATSQLLVLIGSVCDAKQLASDSSALPQTNWCSATGTATMRFYVPRVRRGRLQSDKWFPRRCIAGRGRSLLFLCATPAAFGFVALTFRRMSFMPILISGVIKCAGRTGRFAWHLFVPTRLMSFLL